MDLQRFALYFKIALLCSPFCFLFTSLHMLFYLPQTTYLVFRASTKGTADFRGCLFGEQNDCSPGVDEVDTVNKILLHLKQKSAEHTGSDKKNEQNKQKEAPGTGDESKPRGGHEERVKEGRHGDGRAGDGAKKEIPIHFLEQSMDVLTNIMDELVRIDPNPDRSLRARKGVMITVSCYEKLLARERMEDQGAYSLLTKTRQELGKMENET